MGAEYIDDSLNFLRIKIINVKPEKSTFSRSNSEGQIQETSV
jgi:hypothetical protein